LLGALGARALSDPRVLGLDVVAPAAFLALLAPRMRGRESWLVAVGATAVTLLVVPILPAGVPILVVAMVTAGLGFLLSRTPGTHRTDADYRAARGGVGHGGNQ
jgi:predicted branched-subunit amino acid permease